MKKSLIILLGLIVLVVFGGCTSQSEIDAIQQQNYLLQQQMNILRAEKEAAAEELQAQRNAEKETANFEKNLKCQERGDTLKMQYNNVISAFYDEFANTCYVKYYDPKNENSILTAPIESMAPVQKEAPLPNGAYEIKYTVNFRTSPSTSATVIQKIDPTNIVSIRDYTYDANGDLWYRIQFENMHGYISSKAF